MSEKERKKDIEEGETASKWRRLKESLFGRKPTVPGEELKPEPPQSQPEAEIFSSSLSPQTEPPIEKGSRKKKGRSGSARRQRIKGVRAVVTAAEYDAINERAHNVGLSTGAYLRACALGDKGPRARRAPHVNRVALGEAIAALNRVGNNLNQIAHHLNAGGHPDSGLIAENSKQLDACLSAIAKALGRSE